MSDLGEGLAAKLASFPYVVLTFMGDGGFPFSFPSKERTVGPDGTVRIPKPRGLDVGVGKDPSACILCHAFDESGGNQNYVLLLGEVSSAEDGFVFTPTKTMSRPPDGGDGEEFYSRRAEEYLTKVRPRLHPDERK